MAKSLGYIDYKDTDAHALLEIVKSVDSEKADYYNTDEFWSEAEKEHDETGNSSIEIRPFSGLDYIIVNFD